MLSGFEMISSGVIENENGVAVAIGEWHGAVSPEFLPYQYLAIFTVGDYSVSILVSSLFKVQADIYPHIEFIVNSIEVVDP